MMISVSVLIPGKAIAKLGYQGRLFEVNSIWIKLQRLKEEMLGGGHFRQIE